MGDRPDTREGAIEIALDWAEGRRSNLNVFMGAEAGPENRVHTLALVAQADAAEVAKWTALAAVLPAFESVRDADDAPPRIRSLSVTAEWIDTPGRLNDPGHWAAEALIDGVLFTTATRMSPWVAMDVLAALLEMDFDFEKGPYSRG